MALTKVITDVIDDSIRISSGSLANISGSAVSTGSVGRLEVAGTSADLTVAGDVTVTGRITTKEFQTEFVSASITLATGSNVFGDTTADTHQFTGSVLVTGSLDINNGDVSGSATSTGSFNYIRLGAQGNIDLNSEDITFRNLIDDKDLIFKGSDGGTEVEAMRINYSGNNVGIGTSGIGAKLHVDDDRSTAYNGAAEIAETVLFRNKNGSDDSGVNNVVSIGLQVADGATSQGFINYVRTGNNTGDFTFSQRTASSTYAEHMRIKSNGNVAIGGTGGYQKLSVEGGDIYLSGGRKITWANGNAEITESSYALSFNTYNGSAVTTAMTLTGNNIAYLNGDVVRGGNTDYTNRVYSGYGNGNQNWSVTYPIQDNSSLLITAMFSHYGAGINSYGTTKMCWLACRDNSQSIHNIDEITSSNGGDWAISTSSSTVTVTHQAGNYVGGGHWWVKIEGSANL